MAPAPVTVTDTQYVLPKIYFYVNVYLNYLHVCHSPLPGYFLFEDQA